MCAALVRPKIPWAGIYRPNPLARWRRPSMFKVNEYFNGAVKSIAFQTETLPATVGVMAKGDYEFGTSQKEYMTIVSGSLTVVLPGSDKPEIFKEGQTFIVEANQKFKVTADVETSYLCKYER
jgi:hypothetical protein